MAREEGGGQKLSTSADVVNKERGKKDRSMREDSLSALGNDRREIRDHVWVCGISVGFRV